MPMYEYDCKECGTRFEKLVRTSDDPQAIRCPACASATVARAFSTFATGGGQRSVAAAPSCGPVG
ncbi:MAG: FmdB family zinc ribbon protein [Oscillochloridaceae bacterium umkhey_bin13]